MLWRTGSNTPTQLFAPTASHALDSLDELDQLVQNTAASPSPHAGWLLALSYELGAELEPTARCRVKKRDLQPPWPRILAQRVEGSWAFDHQTARWTPRGCPPLKLSPESPWPDQNTVSGSFQTGPMQSDLGQAGYLAGVRRVLADIRAGDIYQANLGHRLHAEFTGSARALFAALAQSADPWHGAYFEHDLQPTGTGAHPTRLAWCSASPELLLDFDATTRLATTRPMKGTQPLGDNPETLQNSSKEQAELAMIVDLMRNDLGRVAEFGSVRVTQPRAFEPHAHAIRHATATVQARVRAEATASDLIRAVFPAGSITGAPKIRAMQIIDELEPASRGPWCGSMGFLADDGSLRLNVAIRTAQVVGQPDPAAHGSFTQAQLEHWVGAGLVADSVPEAEWDETLLKAEPFRRVLTQPNPATAHPAAIKTNHDSAAKPAAAGTA